MQSELRDYKHTTQRKNEGKIPNKGTKIKSKKLNQPFIAISDL